MSQTYSKSTSLIETILARENDNLGDTYSALEVAFSLFVFFS
jgi:hypothetical protein